MITNFLSGSWTAALVNHLWQSTIVVGIAWLLTWALRKNHARARYWVWMTASVKFLLPFSLLISAGEWLRSLIPAAVARPSIAAAMEQITQPFPQAQPFDAVGPSVATHHAHLLPVLLVTTWAFGALIVLARFGHRWWKVYEAKCVARPLELAADVPVLSLPTPIEPGIFGIFRPVLLLPDGILGRLTAEQAQAIVAHEMCHVRRRDNLTYAIHMVVESLFWFHPAVWWIGARLIDERERACDEAVVRAGSAAEIYVEGILSVCKFYVESPVACIAGVTGADLKNRVARIMARQWGARLTLRKKFLMGAVGLTALTAPIVIGAVQSSVTPPDSLHSNTQMAFDVASVRVSSPDTPARGMPFLLPFQEQAPNTSLFSASANLLAYVVFAYDIRDVSEWKSLNAKLPGWAQTEKFDIEARADGIPTRDQERQMMQTLLGDRFKLAVHFETRQTSVFQLELYKPGALGPEAKPHPQDESCKNRADYSAAKQSGANSPLFCGVNSWTVNGQTHFKLVGVTMDQAAMILGGAAGGTGGREVLPTINRTALPGTYDIDLQYSPEPSGPESSASNARSDAGGPTFTEALKKQLGMKLVKTLDSGRTLVIDHVEQPSPN